MSVSEERQAGTGWAELSAQLSIREIVGSGGCERESGAVVLRCVIHGDTVTLGSL